MQFSESWLRSFVNPAITTAELSHLMTMAGLEVEEERKAAPPFTGIVVAQVLSVEQHPNADKLKVCKVDVGTGTLLNIVCGAPNVAAGMKVPCAMVGAQLPPGEDGKPFVIRVGKLRGVESQGMLCSARELGMSEDHSGLLPLAANAPVGADFRSYADLDDTLFVIKLTPDKGHALSVLGVAREVSALTGAALTIPDFAGPAVAIADRLPVKVSAPDLCGRFSGRVIRGVNAKATTPEWMRTRLERAGQRSISALVDISNYVMLELGRPSHVFDLDKIHGGLDVRWGRKGESLKLLNGETVALDEQVGVIADEREVESLAGIMGGDATAVSLDTSNVYVEAAFWWPDSIRGRARRFNFSTDAGNRFERGVDAATTVEHLERISRLILEICGGQAGPIDDQAPNQPAPKTASMRVSRAVRILGIELDAAECAAIFTRLGMPNRTEGDRITVDVPSYRFDIEIEEDLIEEVARVHGFERIPVRPPRATQRMLPEVEGRRSLHALRTLLAGCDYQESVNFSFVDEAWERDLTDNANPIRLLNPIASQMSVMRSSLIGSLIGVLRYNLNRRADRVRTFEVGRVFRRDDTVVDSLSSVSGVAQPMRVAGLAYGHALADQWSVEARNVDFYDVKADVERLCAGAGTLRFVAGTHPALHPGRCARVELDGQAIGWLGELHPKWQQRYDLPLAPVVFELDAAPLQQRRMPVADEPSRFPLVRRDIAVVVDQQVSAQQMLDCIAEASRQGELSGLVRDIMLFDEYRGKGLLDNEKSLAFRIVMQDTESTLQDDRVDAAMKIIIAALTAQFSAKLRS